MKFKYAFTLAIREIRVYWKMFILYIITLVLLFSVASGLLHVAVYLPEGIADIVSKYYLDTILVSAQDREVFQGELDKNPVELLETYLWGVDENTLGLPEKKYNLFPGVILEDFLCENSLLKDIEETLVEGDMDTTLLIKGKVAPIWISTEMAETYQLMAGSELTIVGSDTGIYVQGIYENEYVNECYFSEAAYEYFREVNSDAELEILIRPHAFRDVFKWITFLEDNEINHSYEKMMIQTMRMLYVMLYGLNIILFVGLYSIFLHLLSTYYGKRQGLFAIYEAMGMTNRDTIRALFCISEIIVIMVSIISMFVYYGILTRIDGMAGELLDLEATYNIRTILPFGMNFMLLQICIGIILYKFSRRFKNKEIVELIRYE